MELSGKTTNINRNRRKTMRLAAKKRETSEEERERIRREELMRELQEVQKSLEQAYEKFSYVVEPELIDSCIYELNAGQMRYKFLLKQMKE
jgi:transposase InsO family protein